MDNIKFKKIGWIGLGAMGKPMAENLLKSGYDLSVYNRTKSEAQKLGSLGAKVAGSAKELMEEVDAVFLMVSDDQAVQEIFQGDNGLLSSNKENKVFINMSTVSPQISEELAQKCTKSNHSYLDAPVSGSVKQATDASLVIMVGGEEEICKQVQPFFEVLGKKAFYIGDAGKGNKTKLAVNLFLSIVTQGLGEAVLFANEIGVEANQILDVINEGGLSSPYVKAKSKSILENDYPSAFSLKHMAKDLRLAKENGFNFALGNAAFDSFNNAVRTLGDFDVMAIIKYLKSTKY